MPLVKGQKRECVLHVRWIQSVFSFVNKKLITSVVVCNVLWCLIDYCVFEAKIWLWSHLKHFHCLQWLKWSCEGGRGLTWRSQVGANPIPIPYPTNLALFGHKITLYRFSQGAHTIVGGLKSEQGAEPPLPPHFNHWLCFTDVIAVT